MIPSQGSLPIYLNKHYASTVCEVVTNLVSSGMQCTSLSSACSACDMSVLVVSVSIPILWNLFPVADTGVMAHGFSAGGVAAVFVVGSFSVGSHLVSVLGGVASGLDGVLL